MRPTDLKFRSPKEKTPDPYDTFVTSNGTGLFQSKNRRKSSFSTARRFVEITSDKASFWRGPGSYDLSQNSISKRRARGTHIYKPPHRGKSNSSNAYYYIGHQVVFDPAFLPSNRRAPQEPQYAVESPILNKPRSAKQSSPSIRRSITPQPEDNLGKKHLSVSKL